MNSLNSFNDDDFKYRSNKPDKIETIKVNINKNIIMIIIIKYYITNI